MRIVIGSVVKGFSLKSCIREHLEKLGHEVIDVGCYDKSVFVKFPSIAERAANVIRKGDADLGVLCCGSGTGVALAAGKFRGICAVSCESPLAAQFARRVNDANVLCMGESLVTPEVGCVTVDAFLSTQFQDAPGIPENVLEFWQEARDEIMERGPAAGDREIETLQ
jgi:ribose 5-phosphate isomerase B